MTPTAALPLGAAALVAAVLGTQVAAGGWDLGPTRAADPCRARAVVAVSTGLEGLGEQLVLLGLDGAACRLHTTREALVLRLAEPGARTDAEVDAVRAGLHDAVDRLDAEHRLPPASSLLDEVLVGSGLPDLVQRALHALPDSLINNRLPTAEVLRRAVDDLDVRALLARVTDPAQVQSLVTAAVRKAVIAQLIAGLH
ncbi:MAG TPA: hypothetical protein VE081_09295 [Sporichthyaceae bacterium]|nr:hypothetical protein [Sporichthyaceae bacterium]